MTMPVDKQIKWNEGSALINCDKYQRQDLTELDTPPKLFMRRLFNAPKEVISNLLKLEKEI